MFLESEMSSQFEGREGERAGEKKWEIQSSAGQSSYQGHAELHCTPRARTERRRRQQIILQTGETRLQSEPSRIGAGQTEFLRGDISFKKQHHILFLPLRNAAKQ